MGDRRQHVGPQDDADSVAAIRHAVERGVNWIDTAAVYGNGHSEEVIAEALTPFGPAERHLVFTKGGIIRDADGTNPRRHAADIRQQCEASLKRLGVERIDLHQLHWPSENVAPDFGNGSVPIKGFWRCRPRKSGWMDRNV